MADASIPVDVFNPGQVLACMGFLEAADVLAGDAVGGFDWSDETRVSFHMRAGDDENPFGRVLNFLAGASIRRFAPGGYTDPPRMKKPAASEDSEGGELLDSSETFPGPTAEATALPIRLLGKEREDAREINVGHWADASSRNDFKLYAGNRTAAGIARDMLHGTPKTPGLVSLWSQRRADLEQDPFGVLTAVGGSFNFDPRGAWTGIDAGYSPDAQNHGLASSPVVEILAAIGLEHSRPNEYRTRRVRYAVWGCLLTPQLARAAVAGAVPGVPYRSFSFELALSGKNKVVTFAKEEVNE